MAFDEFVARNRNAPWQVQNATGALNGPFNVMLDEPSVSRALLHVNQVVRETGLLSPQEIELTILLVARRIESSFEWYAHSRIAREVGVAESTIAHIEAGTFEPTDERVVAIMAIVDAIVRRAELPTAEYAHAEQVLGRPCMLAVIVLAGNYETVADLLRLFEIVAPDQ